MKKLIFLFLVNLMLFTGFIGLTKNDLYAVADGKLCRNFKSADCWYISGGSLSVGYPNFIQVSAGATVVKCCVNGTDMDGCDFSLEDTKCKSEITRAPHDGCGTTGGGEA